MFGEGGCTPHPSSDREPVEIINGLSFATDKVGSENLANSCICLSCWAGVAIYRRRFQKPCCSKELGITAGQEACPRLGVRAGQGQQGTTTLQAPGEGGGQGGSKIAFPKSQKASSAHQSLTT